MYFILKKLEYTIRKTNVAIIIYHHNMIDILTIYEYNMDKGVNDMAHSIKNIKYTAVLPSDYVKELKELASEKIIPSVNFGIRLAIENYIAERKNELYQKQMKEAAKDKSFMNRTLDTQEAFAEVDNEVGGQW